MAKKLKIKLLPNGQIEMKTEGIKGKKCLDYAKFLELIADAKITGSEFTPEYYEEEEETISSGLNDRIYNTLD